MRTLCHECYEILNLILTAIHKKKMISLLSTVQISKILNINFTSFTIRFRLTAPRFRRKVQRGGCKCTCLTPLDTGRVVLQILKLLMENILIPCMNDFDSIFPKIGLRSKKLETSNITAYVTTLSIQCTSLKPGSTASSRP